MNNCRFVLFLLALPFSLAQKPVTLDAITSNRTRDTGGSITWTPDGKSFAYTEGKGLMLYDAATGKKSELANLEALEELAVQAKGKQPFDWENRRVREDQLQWAPDGRRFLYSYDGDIFLWDQGWHCLRRTSVRCISCKRCTPV